MAITAPPPQRVTRIPSRIDQWVLGLHIAAAGAFGIIGFLDVSDPDWGALQRIVIAMIVGVWGLGIFVAWLIARRFQSQAVRLVVMLGGPFLVLVAFFANAMLA